MRRLEIGFLATGLVSALALLTAGPAMAQAMGPAGVAGRTGFTRPIQTDIGMPLPAGALNLSASAGVTTGMANTLLVLDAGLTPRLGLEVDAPYVGLGSSSAYLSELGADVQIGLVGSGRTGLSAVLGLHVPGGSAGLNVSSIQPLVGLRGQGRTGPFLGIANVGYFPGVNQTDIRAAGLWRVNPMLMPGLELRLVGGPVSLAALTPEIQARPIPNLGLALGYEIPIAGSATGQVLAQAQVLF